MKPPQDPDHTLAAYDEVIVRYKYKKTSRVIGKKANNYPEEGTIC